jgi:hypothetical protein
MLHVGRHPASLVRQLPSALLSRPTTHGGLVHALACRGLILWWTRTRHGASRGGTSARLAGEHKAPKRCARRAGEVQRGCRRLVAVMADDDDAVCCFTTVRPPGSLARLSAPKLPPPQVDVVDTAAPIIMPLLCCSSSTLPQRLACSPAASAQPNGKLHPCACCRCEDCGSRIARVASQKQQKKGDSGCRGLVVKASGWPSFDRQFEPYPRAL